MLLSAPSAAWAKEPRAQLRLGNIESVGSLGELSVRARIARALPAFRMCVIDAKGKLKVSGAVRLRGFVVPDGSVLATELASSSLGEREVERCLASVLGALDFPASRDERDSHLHVELLVGDPRRPSADERRVTAGPGDPAFDGEDAPSHPSLPSLPPPRAQVLVEIHPVEGALTEGVAKRASERAARVVRACYEPALTESPGLAGRVVMRSRVTRTGTSQDVRVSMTTLPEALTACVLRASQTTVFGELRAAVVAEWTVMLAPPPDVDATRTSR